MPSFVLFALVSAVTCFLPGPANGCVDDLAAGGAPEPIITQAQQAGAHMADIISARRAGAHIIDYQYYTVILGTRVYSGMFLYCIIRGHYHKPHCHITG